VSAGLLKPAPEKKEAERPHVSPSQLDSYTRCGEAYRRRYIEGHIIPPAFALTKGRAVHAGQEATFKAKLEKGDLLPVEQVRDIAVATFEGTVKAEGVLLTKEEESVGMTKVLGQAKDSTARMAWKLAETVAPRHNPVALEKKFRISLPGPRDLLGYIDLVLEDGFQDLKTGAKKKAQADIDGDFQFTAYAAAFQSLFGKPPERIHIDNIVDRVSDKTAKVTTEHHPFVTTRGPKDIEALAARVNTIVGGIEAGHFMPATPGAWWCSAKSCGYWRTCAFVNSERVAAAEASE
jgi:hypothetical protein